MIRQMFVPEETGDESPGWKVSGAIEKRVGTGIPKMARTERNWEMFCNIS